MENLEELESGVDGKNLLMQLIQSTGPAAPVDLDDDDDDPTTTNQCDTSFSNAAAINNTDSIIIDPFASFDQSNNHKFESENFISDDVVALSGQEDNSHGYDIIAAYPSTTGYYITSENGEQIYEIPPSNVTQQIIVNGNELYLLQDDQSFTDNNYEAIILQPADYNKTNMPEFTINWPADQLPSANSNIQFILGADSNLSNHESLLKVVQKAVKQTNYCAICDVNFDTTKLYKQHMQTHEDDKPFKCDVCQVKFNHLVNLTVHHAMEHATGEYNYDCPICKKHFSRQASFFGHLRTHEIDEDMICGQCSKAFKTQLLLDYHYNEHKQEGYGSMHQCHTSFKCKLCPDDVYLKTIGMMRRHYTQCHPTTSKKKSTVVKPSSHHESENTQQQMIIIKDKEDAICDNSSSQNVEAKSSIRKSKQKAKIYLNLIINAVKKNSTKNDGTVNVKKSPKKVYSCSYCNKSFGKTCLLERHIVCHTKEKKYICSICDKGFTQKSSLKTHMNIHYPNNQHECRDCGKILRYKHTFRNHVCKQANIDSYRQKNGPSDLAAARMMSQQSGGSGSTTNVLRSILVDKRNQLVADQAKMASFDNLLLSQKKSANVYKWNKFVCTICRRRFRHCKALKVHQQKLHNNSQSTKRRRLCRLCSKEFNSKAIWKLHSSYHRRVNLPHLCEHCNLDFPSKRHLSYHLKYTDHSPVFQPRQLQLVVVKSDSNNKDNINPKPLIWDEHNHQLIPVTNATNISSASVTEYPDRQFKCTDCHRSYKSMPHLTAHRKQCHESHNKRVYCGRCSKSFCNDSTLNNHIRSKHLSCGYKCSVCPHQSSTPTLLKRHMKIHSYAKPFVCPICKKNFKTKSYCQAHIRNHNEQQLSSDNINTPTDTGPVNTQTTIFTTDEGNQFTVESSSSSSAVAATYNNNTTGQNEVSLMNYEITDLTSNYQALVGENVFIDHNGLEQYAIQDVDGELINISSNDTHHIKVNHQIFNFVNQTDAAPDSTTNDSSQMQALSLPDAIFSSNKRCSLLESQQALTVVKDQPETPNANNRNHQTLSIKCPLLMEALFKEDGTANKAIATDHKTVPKLETYYGCTKCDHVFVYSRDLVTHAKNVHIISKPYTCSTCSKCYSSRIAVEVHEYKHKPSEEIVKYRCPECCQEFANFLSITRHVVTFHSKERDLYKCTKCQTSYNNIRELKHHVDKHLSDSETVTLDKTRIHKLSSNRASVVFNEEQNEILASVIPTEEMTLSEKYLIIAAKRRKYHWNETSGHLNANERNYQSLYSCKQCHKSFSRPSALKRHSYVHSGLKPFACSQCSKSFKDNVNLKLHVENFHNSKRRVYSCHVCAKSFVSKNGLKSHMLIHTNNLPFKCSHCASAFRTEAMLHHHAQKRHLIAASQTIEMATSLADICANQNQIFNALEFDTGISQMIYVDSIDDPPFEDNITEIMPSLNSSIKVEYKPTNEILHTQDQSSPIPPPPPVTTASLSTNDNDIIIISNELGETSQFCFQSNSFIKANQNDDTFLYQEELNSTASKKQKQSPNEPIKPPPIKPECIDDDVINLSEVKWFCNICKHLFSNKEDYQSHECNNTNNSLASISKAQQRIYNVPSSKRLKCLKCDSTFAYKIGLNKHMRLCHSSASTPQKRIMPQIVCQICNEEFATNTELVNHMTQHYQSRAHICKYCGESFSNRHKLNQHLPTHQSSTSL